MRESGTVCIVTPASDDLGGAHIQSPLERRVAELNVLIQQAAGGPFDIDSYIDVREVLFTRLRLPVPACAIKHGRKHPSTDQEVRRSPHVKSMGFLDGIHAKLNIARHSQ